LPWLLWTVLLAPVGRAAEVTDMAPARRGDLRVEYLGDYWKGHLRQDGEDYGLRRLHTSALRYTLEFAPTDGLAIWLRADQVASERLAFEGASAMGRDPATGNATYARSPPLGSDVVHEGSGLRGVWLGVGVTPYARSWGEHLARSTWRLDAGLRMPDPQHTFFTTKGDHRGVAPGGFGVLVQGAFSLDHDPVDFYLVLRGQLETAATVDVIDEDGTTRISGAKVHAPDTFDARSGVELKAWERDDGSEFAFDLFCGYRYTGWSQVPSGVLLPDVLDATRTEVVPSSDYLSFHGGVGVIAHVMQGVTLRAAVRAEYALPHRPEDPYPVVLGADTYGIGADASVTGHFR